MKKVLSIFTVLAIVSIFYSCKKSDNDPLISFGTRDALITNKWELAKLSKTVTIVNNLGSTDVKNYNFEGTTMVENHKDFYGVETEKSYEYSDVLEIAKDNTYIRLVNEDGVTTETKAFWYWHNSKKNKIGISFNNGTIYFINRLARKELVLEYSEYSITTNENGDKLTVTNNEMLTFSAK